MSAPKPLHPEVLYAERCSATEPEKVSAAAASDFLTPDTVQPPALPY
jgi:hypothetical protein